MQYRISKVIIKPIFFNLSSVFSLDSSVLELDRSIDLIETVFKCELGHLDFGVCRPLNLVLRVPVVLYLDVIVRDFKTHVASV